MTKQSKHMTGKPFTAEVCDAIRHHVGCRIALESKRSNAFDDRDAAKAELEELKNKESPEALKVKGRYADACIQIDDLSTRVKFHSNQVDELVEKADAPSFEFMYEISDLEKREADDDRPVGKPGTPKPKKGGKAGGGGGEPVPEAAQPEGFNQHLTASVNELEVNDRVKEKLVDAEFVTIGQLYAFIEDGKNLTHKLNAGENVVSAVKRALKDYVKKHTKADLEATRDGRGGLA